MIVSDREKSNLIKAHIKDVDFYTNKYKRTLTPQDYEELYSDCLMAVSIAIDDHKVDSPYKLRTLVQICVKHAISSWFDMYMAKKRVYGRKCQLTFTDLEKDDTDDYTVGECPLDKGVIEDKDNELTLTILKDKGILSQEEWGILEKKFAGYLDVEIGNELGLVRSGVQKRKSVAVRKLQAVL